MDSIIDMNVYCFQFTGIGVHESLPDYTQYYMLTVASNSAKFGKTRYKSDRERRKVWS